VVQGSGLSDTSDVYKLTYWTRSEHWTASRNTTFPHLFSLSARTLKSWPLLINSPFVVLRFRSVLPSQCADLHVSSPSSLSPISSVGFPPPTLASCPRPFRPNVLVSTRVYDSRSASRSFGSPSASKVLIPSLSWTVTLPNSLARQLVPSC